jgi:hypothetical protein
VSAETVNKAIEEKERKCAEGKKTEKIFSHLSLTMESRN